MSAPPRSPRLSPCSRIIALVSAVSWCACIACTRVCVLAFRRLPPTLACYTLARPGCALLRTGVSEGGGDGKEREREKAKEREGGGVVNGSERGSASSPSLLLPPSLPPSIALPSLLQCHVLCTTWPWRPCCLRPFLWSVIANLLQSHFVAHPLFSASHRALLHGSTWRERKGGGCADEAREREREKRREDEEAGEMRGRSRSR